MEKEDMERKDKISTILKVIAVIVVIVGMLVVFFLNGPLSNDKKVSIKDFKTYKYDAHGDGNLFTINDKYLVHNGKDKTKLMSLDTKVLYDGKKLEPSYIIEGIDGKIYYYDMESKDDRMVVKYYNVTKDGLKLITTLDENKLYYAPLIYVSGSKDYLLGFASDDQVRGKDVTYLYDLNGNKKTKEGMTIRGDYVRLDTFEPYYTYYKDEVIVANNVSKKNKKYGLYSLKEDKVLIPLTHDFLVYDTNDTLVAEDNKEARVIDKNGKDLTERYDFVAPEDGFYVVGKDGNLAIMDKDFKFVTDFEFPFPDYKNKPDEYYYDYMPCCGSFNKFFANRVDDGYVLTTVKFKTVNESTSYLIDKDGKYKVVKSNEFSINDFDDRVIYAFTDNKVKFFDKKFNEKYEIDVKKEAGFDYLVSADLFMDKVLCLTYNEPVYFDYDTGKKLDRVEVSTKIGDVTVKYNSDDDTFTYYINKDKIATLSNVSIDTSDEVLNRVGNGYFKINNDDYVYFVKSE